MGKIRVDQGQSKLKNKGLKKVKLSGDGQNIKLVRPNITDQTCINSDEFEESISSALASEDRPKPQISKKSKKRKKKKTSKSIGDGTELNMACLAYLNEWKNDQESWKFEKVKQIRLTSNMFDKEKVRNCLNLTLCTLLYSPTGQGILFMYSYYFPWDGLTALRSSGVLQDTPVPPPALSS